MFYVVHKGKKTGIFNTWDECKKNVISYSGAIYKKFNNLIDAQNFLKNGFNNNNINKKYDIIVYTDGACSFNGTNKAIAGLGVYFGKNDSRNVSKKVIGKQTNNVAELLAIFEVSKILKKEIKNKKNILIVSDSKYSINCCSSYGKKQQLNNWKNNIPNKIIVKKIYNIYKKYPNVHFKYIKAHTNNKDIHSIGNFYADKLARLAIL